MGFYAVSSGAVTASGDVNQYFSALSGSVGAQIKLLSAANNVPPHIAQLPSAPSGSDQDVYQTGVSGDAFARVAAYIRASDGYGGVRAGAGVGAPTAHLYAQANGWRTDESLAVGGALNVTGTTTLAGLNAAGISASSLSASGAVSAGGTINANAGIVAHPFNNDDIIQFFDGHGVGSGVIGYANSGGGFYLYDYVHAGFVFQSGTASGITFTGILTAGQFAGPVAIDVEGSQTVIRPGAGAVNVIIQVNGHNWTFRNDGKLITPSGQTIS